MQCIIWPRGSLNISVLLKKKNFFFDRPFNLIEHNWL